MKDEKDMNGTTEESPKKDAGAKVRPKEEAAKAIRRELHEKMGADDAICEACGMDGALDELYEAYEKDGTVPTREAMADLIRTKDGRAAQVILLMKRDPFTVRGNRKLLVAGAVLIGIVAVIGIAVGLSQPVAKEPAPSTPVASESKADKESEVTVHVKADGLDGEIAVPGGIAIAPKGDASSDAEESVFVVAGPEVSCGKFAESGYELAVTSAPILMDGSTYKVPDEPVGFEVAGDGEAVTVEVELEKIPVDGMSKEQLEAVAAQMEASGFGEAAKTLRDKAEGAESKSGSESQIEVAPPRPQGGQGDATEKPSGGNTSPNNGGSKPSGGNSGGGSNGGNSKPNHTHTWVHHDAVYQTVHHDAVYNNVWHEPVYETVVVCLDCGAINPGYEHMEQHMLNGQSGATTVENRLVQEGYNEQVLVSAAWDEQVMVSPAYDSCSCGATK